MKIIEPKTGTVTIDGRSYKTVRIGNQEWLSDNLDSTSHTHGKSWVNDDYGRLYNHAAATSLNLPEEWRVATNSDFLSFKDIYGDEAGKKMKSETGWFLCGNGINESGFNGRPGGYRASDGNFYNRGQNGYWWCTGNDDGGYYWSLYYNHFELWRSMGAKSNGFSVRCVRDL